MKINNKLAMSLALLTLIFVGCTNGDQAKTVTKEVKQVGVSDKDIETFLKDSLRANPSIVSLEAKITEKIPLQNVKGWSAYIVSLDAMVKAQPQDRNIKQKTIWFSNGEVITQDLVDLKTGESLKDSVSPELKPQHYKAQNLIYGNANAKHKVAIFSDPLCPFCRDFVPAAIDFMKKDANKFAIYYYHFPLPAIHPAAVTLVKAAAAAELQGHKNSVLDLYKVEVDPREKDTAKILVAFNKVFKLNIVASDLESAAVKQRYQSDEEVAEDVMVQGTPTMFFDNKQDKSKKLYEKAL